MSSSFLIDRTAPISNVLVRSGGSVFGPKIIPDPSNGGGRSLVAINRAPGPQPPETLRCRRLVGVISRD